MNTNLFDGPNTALLGADLRATPRRRSRAAQDRAWGAALTLIVIVFVFTILARVIAALFARKHQT